MPGQSGISRRSGTRSLPRSFPGPRPARDHGEGNIPMNAILAITLIITLIITSILAAGLTALAMVIAGIHSEERHMNLSADPRTPAETLARHILGARVSQPGARRIFAARHASIAGQAAAHDTARPGPGGLP